MALYKKKHAEVEAVQWRGVWAGPRNIGVEVSDYGTSWEALLDGKYPIVPGDYVVTYQDGRRVVYPEAVFETTYEKVD